MENLGVDYKINTVNSNEDNFVNNNPSAMIANETSLNITPNNTSDIQIIYKPSNTNLIDTESLTNIDNKNINDNESINKPLSYEEITSTIKNYFSKSTIFSVSSNEVRSLHNKLKIKNKGNDKTLSHELQISIKLKLKNLKNLISEIESLNKDSNIKIDAEICNNANHMESFLSDVFVSNSTMMFIIILDKHVVSIKNQEKEKINLGVYCNSNVSILLYLCYTIKIVLLSNTI